MRVFLSQPMKDRSDEEILSERDSIFSRLREKNPDVIEIPSFIPKMNTKHLGNDVYMLANSIKMMSEADLVVFAPGWESANGCVIERAICRTYGIPCDESEFVCG